MLISQDAKGREGYSPRFDPAMSMDYDTLASFAQCIWGFWHHGGARARTVNTWCHFHVEPFFGWLSDLQTRGGFLSCSLAHFMEDIFPRGRQTSGFCRIKVLNNYSEIGKTSHLAICNLHARGMSSRPSLTGNISYSSFPFPPQLLSERSKWMVEPRDLDFVKLLHLRPRDSGFEQPCTWIWASLISYNKISSGINYELDSC